jgi:GH18 family chitinase
MIAFTKDTVPDISSSLDFLNIMTYDMVNRRDSTTGHHTGVALSLDAVNAYLERGLAPEKATLGFAFYVRWYKTDPNGNCTQNPVGCKTMLMEDPSSGSDLGRAGAFAWSDDVPQELSLSFHRAMEHGQYDAQEGGHYYWDSEEDTFWSWDTPDSISLKFPAIVEKLGLAGVFAWGLGEDSKDWSHLAALNEGYASYSTKTINRGKEKKDEL